MHFHYINIPVGYFMSTELTFLAVQVVGSSNVGAPSTSVVAVKLLGFPEIYIYVSKSSCVLHAFDFTCTKWY
jgi:hypothetical protein